MILTCPACATSYFAPDEAIGPNGRRVRCQGCGEVWRATADEPLELTPAESAPKAASEPEPEVPASLAETPAPELPRAFRARAEQQRRLRRAATHGAVWAGLASLFVGLAGAAWLFRVEVVDMVPRAAAAYALVGTPVNPMGLDFEAVRARTAPHDPGKVVVSGALRNVRDREVVAPPVRVALLDAEGREIAHDVVRIDAPPVLPGKVQGFAVLLPDPGGRAQGVGVDFAPEPKRDPTHPPVERAPAAPSASLRAPPPAAEALRPALAPGQELGLEPVAPPVEAQPVAAVPATAQPGALRPALDSRPAEAVSASHG